MTAEVPRAPSFKVVRTQPLTYSADLQVLAIENGFLINSDVGVQHYPSLDALRQALLGFAEGFVETVEKLRAEAAAKETP